MNFNGKMVFLWWLMLWRMWRLKKYGRKYAKLPSSYTPQQRNNYLLKRAKWLIKLFNIDLEVEGYENLTKGPMILAPNHKSNIDAILMLVALEKQTKDTSVMNKIPTFLAKKELAKKKLVKSTLNILDTFFIDRNDFRNSLQVINDFGLFVKNNRTYGVVFPEGHRVNDKAELNDFKAGAFKVAQKNYMPVVPVAISDTRDALNKNRSKKLKVKIKFLKPLKPHFIMAMNTQTLAQKVKSLIEEELKND